MKTFYGPAGSSFSDLFPSRSFSFSFELAKKIKKEKKGGGGKEYIHRFPGLTAKKEPERLEFAAKSSNETTSYSHAILALSRNYFYPRLRRD